MHSPFQVHREGPVILPLAPRARSLRGRGDRGRRLGLSLHASERRSQLGGGAGCCDVAHLRQFAY